MRKLKKSTFAELNLKKYFFNWFYYTFYHVDILADEKEVKDPIYEEYLKNYLGTTRWQTI